MACGPDLVDVPVSSTSQETLDGKLGQSSPVVIVLVADDAATAEAAALRADMVKTVRAGLLSEIEQSWGSCGSPDPAMWHPEDVRVVVVRPSAPDAEALVTPIEMPSLAWISNTSTEAEAEAVTAASGEAMEQRLAIPGEPFRPLRAAKRTVELLTGTRAPATDSEAALLASLPEYWATWLVIAATRDDEDQSPVEALALDSASTELVDRTWVIGPFSADAGACGSVSGPGDTRLQVWGYNSIANLGAWPCDDVTYLDSVLTFCCADCGQQCHSRPLVISPEGIAECRVYVDQVDLTHCDPALGLQDPDGKPAFVERQGQELRRCEVIPLRDAALEACRSSLDCKGCTSGWCATEVPELSYEGACGPNQHVWPLRFVGGPLSALGSYLHAVCQTR